MKQVNIQKSKVKKVIIPAAGWGTRFLPMTKIIPKELVPILNRPSIDLLVDEAINSGIEEIILVISTRKQEIMKYFQPNIPLEEELKSKNKWELLKHVKKTNRDAIIRVVYQYEQLGLAHAILTGARFFKNEPFAVILGDDLIKSKRYFITLDDLIRNIIKRFYILIDSDGYEFIYNNDKKIMVKADKKRLEQVIYNLLNNAVNYTGEDKKIYINVTEDKKKVLVEIRDTGKGIDKDEIKYIWNKYYHNEKKHKRNAFGTGLGLSIVKTILESHNYKYGVKSVKNHGTTFYFEIDKKNML